MAYQLPIDKYEYDTIHGKAKQTVEIDGDFLVLDGKKLLTSRCRDPKEVGWGALGAD
jgi:glyceraldehyde 3-phosphate dehydrogenase